MPCHAAGFGTVAAIAGEAADIALDETRGVVYVANFTGSRIDVMSTATGTIQKSISVLPWPGSLALSPDAQYLLVTHYGQGFTRPGDFNGLTLLHLTDNSQQTFITGDPPLAAAFYNNQASGPGKVLFITTTAFYTMDPTNAVVSPLITIANVSETLPVPVPTWPSQIVQAEMATSGDRFSIWGIASAQTPSQLIFKFDSRTGQIIAGLYTSTPLLLPRVSVSADGTYGMVGYWLLTSSYAPAFPFVMLGRYPNALTSTAVAGHAIDSTNSLIYMQVPDANQPTGPPFTSTTTSAGSTPSASPPTLSIMDADNLTVRDRILIPQNMVGRAVLNAAKTVLYAISDSGVMTLPVGTLNQQHRVLAAQEDLLVQTNFCDRSSTTQSLTITDPGGGNTDFTVTSSSSGVQVVPSSGTTPATVQVVVNPSAFETLGTSVVTLTLTSNSAINIPRPVRVLVNNPDVNQRGTIVDVPGVLTDILPDSARNRYYVIRQDLNQLLIFDGTSNQKITALRTATTPTMMSLTNDQNYLVVGHDNSELATVYDLNQLQQEPPVVLPFGHFARSIAASNGDFLTVVREEGQTCPPPACIDVISFTQLNQPPGFPFRAASPPTSLGIFNNSGKDISPDAVLAPSPNGSSILVAEPNGTVMLYSADNNTYQGRQDLTALSGGYAASAYDTYVVGNNVFDASLVPIGAMNASYGTTSGFAFAGQGGYRLTALSAAGPGGIQDMTALLGGTVMPTPMTEAPILPSTTAVFTRTVAPLPSAGTVIALTISGVTVLSANYAAATAPPAISSVVSAADGSAPVAAGGLISVYGSQMSPVNIATSQIPLPTALGESCLVVNGTPIPLLFVSSGQINAQLPFNLTGSGVMSIHTPAGISNNFNFTINGAAPSIFMSGTAGPETGLATVVRADDGQLVTPTNPIHYGDTLVIYLTGMGSTSPAVSAGLAAPMSPLSWVTQAPSLTLGGSPLTLLYYGLVPGEISGLYQINATVPSGVTQGLSIPLVINQGGGSTTLNVRVVN
ncbi:MAG: hypothetical protein ABSF62_18240 [Bryobacteraceae bacterium]